MGLEYSWANIDRKGQLIKAESNKNTVGFMIYLLYGPHDQTAIRPIGLSMAVARF